MDRTFTRSTRRRRRTLDGQWEFVTDPEDEGEREGYAGSFPDEADSVPVPCSWTALPEYADYVGPAWYRKRFVLPEETSASFTFQGVAHDATVYVDGEEVFSHAGGYTPFSTYVRDLDAGEHDLVLRVDNRRNEAALLHGATDWYPHGGIHREVILEEISGLWITDLETRYELDGDDATVTVETTVHNVSHTPSEGQLAVSVGDATEAASVEVGGFNATIENFELAVEGVDRWSPEDPTLYDVVAAIPGEAGGDDLRERVGFREIAVEDDEILLNGEPVTLAGVNREGAHPDWGQAEPLRIQRAEIEAIVDAGFNAVRAARYPPHPRFLDLCDEAGLLVVEGVTPHEADTDVEIEEVPGIFEEVEEVDLPPTDPEDPTGESRRIVTEMVERDLTHPSVIAWDLGNSAVSPGEGMAEALDQLGGTVKGVDDSRLVVAACRLDHVEESAAVLDRSDLVCVNADRRARRNWDEAIDAVREEAGEKPLVVTEFGVEGVPGERSLARREESESHQSDYLTDAVETFRDRDDVAGFAVRGLTDTLAGTRGPAPVRTTDYSGLLTGYRQPKVAYDALRRILGDR